MSARRTKIASAGRSSRTDRGRLRRLPDREIDYSDIPPTTPEFWASAAVVQPSRKIPVSLRLDKDVLTWFKGRGARYQTRINAVLRAYVDRHTSDRPTVRESAATYRTALLADLEVARERFEALEVLPDVITPRLFDCVAWRIKALGDEPQALKLPVLFFALIRRDPRQLRRFDEFLGRLRRSHRRRDLSNLLDRLRSEEDYRQAVGALFEVEILQTLLDVAPAGSVSLYPRIGKTPSYTDAAIRLGDQMAYLEIKLVSQTARQERVQDIGIESAFGQPGLSAAEKRALGLHSVREGVVTGVGDPYGDALRVIGKLAEKPSQLHPDAPNVICLGLADFLPDARSAEWAIEAAFSGSDTIPRLVAEQTHDVNTVATLERLVREAKPEPRLTGVLVFDVKEGQAHPVKACLNPTARPSNRLDKRGWQSLLMLFGFPPHGAAGFGRS